jgi:hypothetical protein
MYEIEASDNAVTSWKKNGGSNSTSPSRSSAVSVKGAAACGRACVRRKRGWRNEWT